MSELWIKGELTRTFTLKTLRKEANRLTGKDWKQYQSIRNRYAEAREEEIRAFNDEFDTRLEQAKKDLMNKAASPDRKLVHRWFGSDKFDPSTLERQAFRKIHEEHYAVMAKLEAGEIKDTDALIEKSGTREQEMPDLTQEFSRATDRRSGEERRQSKHNSEAAWSHARAMKRER